MSVIRIDPLSQKQVVVAPERAKRPQDVNFNKTSKLDSCPFCPGNENQTPPELFRLNENKEKWIVRTFNNKYPAFTNIDADKQDGQQEVLVESDKHNQHLAEYSQPHLTEVLKAYKSRIQYYKSNKRTRYIVVFKNHGRDAGASLAHPHSQIVALNFVPEDVRKKIDNFNSLKKTNGTCKLCNIEAQTIIAQNEDFIAFIPEYGLVAYHCYIVPRVHDLYYENQEHGQLNKLAEIILKVMRGLNKKLDKPPYNLLLNNMTYKNSKKTDFHWNIEIIPRTAHLAGFEWATGLYINPVDPFSAATEIKMNIERN